MKVLILTTSKNNYNLSREHRDNALLYAGAGVGTPDTPLIHLIRWILSIRLPDPKKKKL